MSDDYAQAEQLLRKLGAATSEEVSLMRAAFDADFYRTHNSDVEHSGMNPLIHFALHGFLERRWPFPPPPGASYPDSFSSLIRLASEALHQRIAPSQPEYDYTYGDEVPSQDDIARHVRETIEHQFDAAFYRAQLGDAATATQDLVGHYVRIGWTLRLDPHPSFSTEAYCAASEDVVSSGMNPYYHYLVRGRFEARHSEPSARAVPELEQPPIDVSYATVTMGISDEQVDAIRSSGAFDIDWYWSQYGRTYESPTETIRQYLREGEANGNRPNPHFDPSWYQGKYFAKTRGNSALLHYLTVGDAENLRPIAYLDTEWYKNRFRVPRGTTALVHYLRHHADRRTSPSRYFDVDYYLDANPDVRQSKIDPFTHWYTWGIYEGRRGSQSFDSTYVWNRYLGGDRSKHPLDHMEEFGTSFGWSAVPDESAITCHSELKKYANAGPEFESQEAHSLPLRRNLPKVMAFYLPQFHAIAENDEWWGTGFTEWRNIPRSAPRFPGHYQPRIPRDLGFYDLASPSAIFRKQIQLARESGVSGFCFYYYNFAGRRLLEGPLDAFISDSGLSFPFSIMWANESWSRRWDGSENEVLMAQDYSAEHIPELAADLARYLKHPSYWTIGDRPMLFIYRADVIPECASFVASLRKEFRSRHDIDPIISVAQTFGVLNPTILGFDGAIEFPPHKIGSRIPWQNPTIDFFDNTFSGSVRNYSDAMDACLDEPTPDFPLIKTAFPSWDNDARKQGAGMCFQGASPQLFQKWMEGLLLRAAGSSFHGDQAVFVNAWNEWCEGAYLEPDVHFGFANLNAIRRALTTTKLTLGASGIVLVGHDAFNAGAQLLLLHIGDLLRRRHGARVRFVLLSGGELIERYHDVAPTFVRAEGDDGWASLRGHLADLQREGFACAITNTVVSGTVVPLLKELGFRATSLIHELPTIIQQYSCEESWNRIATYSDLVIYPNNYVKNAIEARFSAPSNQSTILPQGLYHTRGVQGRSAQDLRAQLGIPESARVVVNVGYGDYRKGIDLFVATAGIVTRADSEVHFVWIGAVHPDLHDWLRRDVELTGAKVHFVGFVTDVASYLSLADVFFLSSREDPFPSVILEALSEGVPCVTFDEGGGYVDLIRADSRLGALARYGSAEDAARRIVELLDDPSVGTDAERSYRRQQIEQGFDFTRYCGRLLKLASPRSASVSAVVPNFNHARFLDSRLQSVFAQTHPVDEVLVLDDHSTDDSQAVLSRITATSERIFRIITNDENSGNTFKQWLKGVESVNSEYIWIAESDDDCDPGMLNTLLAHLGELDDPVFAFCDSRSIDEHGEPVFGSYIGYYESLGHDSLARSGRYEADDFARRFLSSENVIMNASSVVWRRAKLLEALRIAASDLRPLKCAGDWVIYLQACALGGQVAYVAEAMNVHRRHAASVTHSQPKKEHLAEIEAAQAFAKRHFQLDARARERQQMYIEQVDEHIGNQR